jgi:hypothetical protein
MVHTFHEESLNKKAKQKKCLALKRSCRGKVNKYPGKSMTKPKTETACIGRGDGTPGMQPLEARGQYMPPTFHQ